MTNHPIDSPDGGPAGRARVRVELGRCKVDLRELSERSVGQCVELDHEQGDAVEIYADGRLFARGEAVRVGEEMGVRITERIGVSACDRANQ